MQRLSITKGHAFILVYSVCSRQSLEELKPIWQLIKEIKAENLTSIPVMLGEFWLFTRPRFIDINLSTSLFLQLAIKLTSRRSCVRCHTQRDKRKQPNGVCNSWKHQRKPITMWRSFFRFGSQPRYFYKYFCLHHDNIFQELLNMEKNRNVSLTDSKSNKKKGKSKKKEQNGSAGPSGEGGGAGKEKCQVM